MHERSTLAFHQFSCLRLLLLTSQDVFRAVERLLSAREPPSADVKCSCANVLRALGACGGAFLWANSLAGFEAAKALCLAGIGDADAAVRAAFAQALAAIAVASSSGVWVHGPI